MSLLQSTVGTLHRFKYCPAANPVDREIETFLLLNFGNKIGNLSSGAVQKNYFHICFLTLLSAVLHAILIMVQATTLNVAFNSHNKSLLTIMMSNNVSM